MSGAEKAKSTAIRFALSMGKRQHFATGGVVGPLIDTGPGRTDTLPISVPPGSYVVPADVVSGLPGAQGNSLAGHDALEKLMNQMPLVPDKAPYGADTPKLPSGRTIPGLFSTHHLLANEFDKASGGGVKGNHVPEDGGKPIDIMAAGGEHVIPPEMVRRIGLGDLKRGHQILDEFVKEVRKRNIRDLKKLPGPVKDGTK